MGRHEPRSTSLDRPSGENIPAGAGSSLQARTNADGWESSLGACGASFNAPDSKETLPLHLQRGFVRRDERPDGIGHIEELQPLFLVQGYRETPHSIDREPALLADFHGDAGSSALFERGVLVPQ